MDIFSSESDEELPQIKQSEYVWICGDCSYSHSALPSHCLNCGANNGITKQKRDTTNITKKESLPRQSTFEADSFILDNIIPITGIVLTAILLISSAITILFNPVLGYTLVFIFVFIVFLFAFVKYTYMSMQN